MAFLHVRIALVKHGFRLWGFGTRLSTTGVLKREVVQVSTGSGALPEASARQRRFRGALYRPEGLGRGTLGRQGRLRLSLRGIFTVLVTERPGSSAVNVRRRLCESVAGALTCNDVVGLRVDEHGCGRALAWG